MEKGKKKNENKITEIINKYDNDTLKAVCIYGIYHIFTQAIPVQKSTLLNFYVTCDIMVVLNCERDL